MLSYVVPRSVLEAADRHDERFFNRRDIEHIVSFRSIDDLYLLGNILTDMGTGKALPREVQGDGDVAYIRIGNVKRFEIDYENADRVPISACMQAGLELLRPGDLLISRVGTVGNVALYGHDEMPAAPTENVIVLRLNVAAGLLPAYVCAFLNSELGQAQIRRFAKQSLQEVINQKAIHRLLVPRAKDDVQRLILNRVNVELGEIRRLRAEILSRFQQTGSVVTDAFALDESFTRGRDLAALLSELRTISERAATASQQYKTARVRRTRRPSAATTIDLSLFEPVNEDDDVEIAPED